jgi:hypothetical protein
MGKKCLIMGCEIPKQRNWHIFVFSNLTAKKQRNSNVAEELCLA